MTAATATRLTDFAGLVPAQGTYRQAADTLILGGTMVSIDSSGRADVITAGQHCVGVAVADSDNRTTAPEGGAAGAVDTQVAFGVMGLEYTGTTPSPGDVVYAVDNQTVAIDSDGGSRGIAGYCTEVDGSQCYVRMGVDVVAEIVSTIGPMRIVVPVTAFRNADGTALAAFADGSADGIVVSEGAMYRWNVSSADAIWAEVPLPDYLDASADITVRMMVSREGAADTDLTIDVGAYLVAAGSAYTADADAGGSTGAIDQATTVVSEETVTIAAADVPSSAVMLGLSIAPDAALDSDDLNLHGVVIEITRTAT